MKPFTELMDIVLSPLKSVAIQGAANLAANIGTTVQLCITLYIILFGWQIARGEITEPWNEFAKRAVKLGLIVGVLQSPALYKEYVIDFLAEILPDALSNAMSGNPVPDANKFDTLAAKFGILLTQVWQGTGWSAPAATARAAVVTLLVMPFVWGALIVGFVVTLWAKAGMYFVATLGPLFIAFAMFEQPRRYLHNWLDQVVSMIALQVLVAMTCGLVLEGLERAVKDAPTPENIFALAGKVIVLTVFSLAIWSSLPRLASKLGGYGASVAGAGSRAAPLDTLRAPISSFSENGAAPLGRPELASIASRSGDAQNTAPIMPSPIVAPSRSDTGSFATAAHVSHGTSVAGDAIERSDTRHSAQGTAAAATPPVAASTATIIAAASREIEHTGIAPSSASPLASKHSNGFAATGLHSVNDSASYAFGQQHDAQSFAAAAREQTNGTTRKTVGSFERSAPSTAGVDDDALIDAQRTGFEGINFEQPSPRAADTVLVAAATLPVPVDDSSTMPAATVPQDKPTPRRSS